MTADIEAALENAFEELRHKALSEEDRDGAVTLRPAPDRRCTNLPHVPDRRHR